MKIRAWVMAVLLLAAQLLGAGRAVAATADLSVWSAVTTVIAATAPDKVNATAVAGGVALSWTAPTPAPAKGYYVYRGTTAGFVPGTPLMDFPVLGTSFTDTTARPGQTYYYIVEAVGGGRSASVMVTVPAAAQSPEAVRTILFTEGDNQATRLIRLADGTTTPTVFPLTAVPRLVSGRLMVPAAPLAQALGARLEQDQATGRISLTLDGATLSLWLGKTDGKLAYDGREVNFLADAAPAVIDGVPMLPLRLTAGMLGADLAFDASDRTAIVRYPAEAPLPTTVANQPQSVSVTSAGGKVQVTWKAPSGGAPSEGYYVYRFSKADFDPWYPQNDYPLLTRSFTDDTAEAGKTYYYMVEAVNGGRSRPVAVTVTDTPAGPAAKVIQFKENSLTATVDGKSYQLDAAAQIVGGRMLVPLRFLGDALGADIQYDAAEHKITYTLDGRKLVLWQGSTEALLGGKPLTLDVPPSTVNGRTLIPLRFVSENLGATVGFDPNTRVATITYQGSAGPGQPAAPEADTSVNSIRFGIYELRTALIGYTVQFWTPAEIEISGALVNSLLQLNPDGTYVWASKWDGAVIRGTWRVFDSASILLSHGESNRDWLITAKPGAYSSQGGDDIDLYNESTQYLGRYAGEH